MNWILFMKCDEMEKKIFQVDVIVAEMLPFQVKSYDAIRKLLINKIYCLRLLLI